ncbi:unnamed protein product [Ectocarpus sp. 13 AM-2016]
MDRYMGSTMFCKECAAESDIYVDPRAGEIICRTCAVVIGERCIDDGAEWQTYAEDSTNGRADPNRCGAAASPLLSAKSGMNTLIEGGQDSKLTAKLQKLQGMAVKESASERALKMDFFGKVREFGNRLGLTHAMQEHACLLLRKAEDSGLFKVKKAERGVAICVAVTLLTCRQWRRGQTMKEMSTMFNVSLKALNKAVKKLSNLEIERAPSLRGEHHIPPLCDKLGLPPFVSVAARHAAQQASRWDLVDGMKPSAVAAAAVLLVCSCWNPAACGDGVVDRRSKKVRKTQQQQQAVVEGETWDVRPAAVSEAGGTTVMAMKRPFRAMYEQRGRLFTVEFLERRAAKEVTLETLKPILV